MTRWLTSSEHCGSFLTEFFLYFFTSLANIVLHSTAVSDLYSVYSIITNRAVELSALVMAVLFVMAALWNRAGHYIFALC